MKKILLLATGGTIACKSTENGLSPLMSSEELVSFVPKSKEFCTVDTIQLMNIDSTNMHPDCWLQIAAKIESAYPDYDGFVIAHGTDTMAYTASALSYLIQSSPKPIVLTGSQKPMDMDMTDAKANLMDSLRYACFEEASGVVVVFGGKVIMGTRARKMNTKSYDAFSSINYPAVAVIHDRGIIQYIQPVSKTAKPVFYHRMDPHIFVLKLIPGVSAQILKLAAESYDAFVLESYGVGGIPEGDQYDFLRQRHTHSPVPPETTADILYQYITFSSFFKHKLCTPRQGSGAPRRSPFPVISCPCDCNRFSYPCWIPAAPC